MFMKTTKTFYYAIIDKYGNQITRSKGLQCAKGLANKHPYVVAIKTVEHIINEEVIWKKGEQ